MSVISENLSLLDARIRAAMRTTAPDIREVVRACREQGHRPRSPR